MRIGHIALALIFGLSAATPMHAADVHYAPTENLEHIDVALIGTARERIEIAAYVLSDWPVIDALIAAVERGVEARIVLDRSQLSHSNVARLSPIAPFVRVSPSGPIMHLKAYSIDGRRLRTGSANFSASGLKQQANDLVLIDEAPAIERFQAAFEREWKRAMPLEP